MNRFGPLLVLVTLAVLLIACGSPPDPQTAVTAAPAPRADGPATVTGTAEPNALVALEPPGGPPPLPEGPAVLDQYAKQFVPDQLFVRVGQSVEFRNSDDVDHNVQVLRTPTGTTVMNESGSSGQLFRHVFQQSGIYDVNCDVHPGMRATIVVATSPYAAVADRSGRFSIADVPAGAYVMKVNARGREVTQPLTVTAPRTEAPLR